MSLYLLNCLIVVLYGVIISPNKSHKRREFFLLLTYVHLLLFHILRDPFIYPDSDNYLDGFNLAIECSSFKDLIYNPVVFLRFEPGYMILNYIASRFCSSEYTIFIASSIIIISGYVYVVKRYSKSPLLSILIILLYPLIFQQSFFVLRQHIACAIFMFSLPYIETRQLGKYILIVFCAIMFHYSAIVLLPLYWIYSFRLSSLKPMYIIYFIVFYILARLLLNYVSVINDRYSDYMLNGGNLLVCAIFLLTSVLYIIFIKNKRVLLNNSENRMIITYNMYALIICLITLGLSLGRMTNYFSFYLCVIIPFLYKKLPKPLGVLVASIFMVFIVIFNYFALEDPFLYKIFINN